MKGIILAGGSGSRLWPATSALSKQLLPIYDKPLIYYPLATLLQIGIKKVLIITRKDEEDLFRKVLGNGQKFGIEISYGTQNNPSGIAEALLIAEEFLDGQPTTLILGDNIFHGLNFKNFQLSKKIFSGAHIFTYEVNNPQDFGVIKEIDGGKNFIVIEKPSTFVSNFAVTGLYMFDEKASNYAKTLKPSARGELEISDLINIYSNNNSLTVSKMERGAAWLDTGTALSMHDASTFVRILEERTGTKIACLEEIALNQGLISKNDLEKTLELYPNSKYKEYVANLIA